MDHFLHIQDAITESWCGAAGVKPSPDPLFQPGLRYLRELRHMKAFIIH